MVGAVGLIGLLLVGAGIFGIVRARRRSPEADASETSDPDGGPVGPRAGRAVDGSAAPGDRKGGVYGGGAPAGGAGLQRWARVAVARPRPAVPCTAAADGRQPPCGGYGAPRPDGGAGRWRVRRRSPAGRWRSSSGRWRSSSGRWRWSSPRGWHGSPPSRWHRPSPRPAAAVVRRVLVVVLAAACTAVMAASPAPAAPSRPGAVGRSPTIGASGPGVGVTTTRPSTRTGRIPGAVAATGATATNGRGAEQSRR